MQYLLNLFCGHCLKNTQFSYFNQKKLAEFSLVSAINIQAKKSQDKSEPGHCLNVRNKCARCVSLRYMAFLLCVSLTSRLTQWLDITIIFGVWSFFRLLFNAPFENFSLVQKGHQLQLKCHICPSNVECDIEFVKIPRHGDMEWKVIAGNVLFNERKF